MARSVDLTPISPKIKLIKEITDKLKSPKQAAFTPNPRMTKSQTIEGTFNRISPKKIASPQK